MRQCRCGEWRFMGKQGESKLLMQKNRHSSRAGKNIEQLIEEGHGQAQNFQNVGTLVTSARDRPEFYWGYDKIHLNEFQSIKLLKLYKVALGGLNLNNEGNTIPGLPHPKNIYLGHFGILPGYISGFTWDISCWHKNLVKLPLFLHGKLKKNQI